MFIFKCLTGAPEEIRTPDPQIRSLAAALKSLRSVTARKPLVVEIGVIRQFLNGLSYRKNERHS